MAIFIVTLIIGAVCYYVVKFILSIFIDSGEDQQLVAEAEERKRQQIIREFLIEQQCIKAMREMQEPKPEPKAEVKVEGGVHVHTQEVKFDAQNANFNGEVHFHGATDIKEMIDIKIANKTE